MPDDIVRSALGDVIEVRERLAEVGTDVKHLAHDVKNLLQAMGNFVPRQEIMEMRNASMERSAALHARIDQVEQDFRDDVREIREAQTWFVRKMIGGVISGCGLAGAFALGVAKLLGH